MERWVYGIPLGYETLGLFYNKGLLRDIPETWNELEALYNTNLGEGKYPTNLGLGPRYTPNASDLITAFMKADSPLTYKSLSNDSEPLTSYFNFRMLDIPAATSENDEESLPTNILTLKEILEDENKTTYDAFMQGDIALILGYPSIVSELEKSTKRSGIDSVENLVLTAPIPQESLGGQKRNIAKYTYLSISKLSKNGLASARFLEYLMTDEGTRQIQEIYPHLIPPKPSLYEAWREKQLSEVLPRTKLDAFIPEL